MNQPNAAEVPTRVQPETRGRRNAAQILYCTRFAFGRCGCVCAWACRLRRQKVHQKPPLSTHTGERSSSGTGTGQRLDIPGGLGAAASHGAKPTRACKNGAKAREGVYDAVTPMTHIFRGRVSGPARQDRRARAPVRFADLRSICPVSYESYRDSALAVRRRAGGVFLNPKEANGR